MKHPVAVLQTTASMEISTIDWNRLSQKMNEAHNTELSFAKSYAVYNPNTGTTRIYLHIENKKNDMSYYLNNEDNNTYTFSKDENGNLFHLPSRSSEARAPNPQSLRIRNVILYNIISEYIQPFIEKVNLSST